MQSLEVNIIFMACRFDEAAAEGGMAPLVIDQVEGTSHANLQQAVLYKDAPHRDDFCQQIKSALNRGYIHISKKIRPARNIDTDTQPMIHDTDT
jgi:hypothetical protein